MRLADRVAAALAPWSLAYSGRADTRRRGSDGRLLVDIEAPAGRTVDLYLTHSGRPMAAFPVHVVAALRGLLPARAQRDVHLTKPAAAVDLDAETVASR